MRQILFWTAVILLLGAGGILAQDDCSNSSFPTQATVSRLSSSHGGLDGFYSIATGIADGLHGKLTTDLMQRFANVVEGNDDDISGLVSEVLKKQAGFIIFILIGLIFIIIFPIVGCCYCCCRCCCNKCGAIRYQKEDASKTGLVVLIIAVVICFAFLLTGTIIYGKSVSDGANSVDMLNTDVDNLANDLKKFVLSTGDQLLCSVQLSVHGAIDNINDALMKAPNNSINLFTNITGLDNLNDLVDSATTIRATLTTISSASGTASSETDPFTANFNNLVSQVNSAYSGDTGIPMVDPARNELTYISLTLHGLPALISNASASVEEFLKSTIVDNKNTANKRVQEARDKVTGALHDVMEQVTNAKLEVDKVVSELRNLTSSTDDYISNATDAIDDAHKHYEDFGGKNAIVALVSVIVLLPCVIALVLIAIGSACGAAGYRKDCHPPQRTSLSHAAGCAAIATCIFLFAIGGFLMFLSTMLFTAGYAVQFACQPIFYDDTYQVFNYIDQFIPNITNPIDNTIVPISISDALRGCANRETIYKAVNGDRIFNVDQILSKIQFDASKIDTHIDQTLDFNLTQAEISVIKELQNDLVTVQKIFPLRFNDPPTKDTTAFLNNLVGFLNTKPNSQTLVNQANDLIRQAPVVDSSVAQVITYITDLNSLISQVLDDIDFLLNRRTQASVAVTIVEQFAVDLFSGLNNTAYRTLGDFQIQLNNNIAMCGPLYDTYQNVGDLICKKLGHPLQGMWASLGLVVLFFIPTIIALTLISKYLYRMDREHYSLLTGGSMYSGQRLDRVAPEVINIPRSFISEEPETPIKRVLDDQSDEFKYEPNGEYGSNNKSANFLGETSQQSSNRNVSPAGTTAAFNAAFEQPYDGYDPHAHIKPRSQPRGLRRVAM